MLTSDLDDRLQRAAGIRLDVAQLRAARFAADYARLLAQALPRTPSAEDTRALREALQARCDLPDGVLAGLISNAMQPDARAAIGDAEIRAYTSRFGRSEGEALRQAIADDLDLRNFAARYGTEEALLLLDSLFSLSAVDGVIDGQEIGPLQRAARELGVDPALVSALFRKHDVRHATGDFTFMLDRERMVIGRSNGIDIQLPDALIAPRHAVLVRTGEARWRVEDLGSGRPTLVNGSPVKSSPLMPGDNLRLGAHVLTLDQSGTTLTVFGASSVSALTVHHLKRQIGDTSLLDDVGFTVFTGEVVAVVGPSGAGKTTLLNAITGVAKADSGEVWLDGEPFHHLLAHDPSMVGFVPQDDVVHAELTVEEALTFSAKLRFPPDVSDARIAEEVERVLVELGIDHIRDSRIGDATRRGISGGQRKRVNLGQELLTRGTRILFLDEPTSGLDPQTSQDIFQLVRRLADAGRMVFIVTHDLSPSLLSAVDHLMVLSAGGRLAWFGPPREATAWFDVASADELFRRLPEHPTTWWRDHFQSGEPWRKYVRTREHLLGLDGVHAGALSQVTPPERSLWGQYTTLSERTMRTKLRDLGGLAVQLAQAPILGLAMVVVFPRADTATLFVLVLSALWFGASSSVRELIAERAIWKREARVGLRTAPYMASKVTVLGLLVALQCFALSTMLWLVLDMGAGAEHPLSFSLLGLTAVTTATGWVGISLGLCLSAMFSSSEAAVAALPLVLIPQITFGGLLVKVKQMSALAKAVTTIMVTRFAFDAALKTGEQVWVPSTGYQPKEPLSLLGVLSDLGFRPSGGDPLDLGMTLLELFGSLGAFFAVFLGVATWLTSREARKS